MKNKKAFTLVEVAVVAVVIGIISTVSIVLYQGHVVDSRTQSAQQIANAAASSAYAMFRRVGAIPAVNQLNLGPNILNEYNIVINQIVDGGGNVTGGQVQVTSINDPNIIVNANF